MIKLILFYGGILLCVVVTFAIWIIRPPKLRVCVVCDEQDRVIRCSLKVSRSFGSMRVTGLWIPTEYMQALGAVPPVGFKEQPDRFVPGWLYDGAKREVVEWRGRLDIPKGAVIELSMPAKHPTAISGTLCFRYEYRGVAGVGLMSTVVHAPFNTKAAA